MYYSNKCPYCGKTFYTFESSKENAAEKLFNGIKKHQRDYGEDAKEHSLDDSASTEINDMYKSLGESEEEPSGGYLI